MVEPVHHYYPFMLLFYLLVQVMRIQLSVFDY